MSQIHTGSSRILQKIWVMSLALSSATNTDCLLSSGRFHYIVAIVLGRHPIVLCSHNTGPSPIFYPRSSSWCKPQFFFMITSILSIQLLLWFQLFQWPSCFLTLLRDAFITSRLVAPPGRFLHYQVIFPGQSPDLPLLEHSFCVLTQKKQFPEISP